MDKKMKRVKVDVSKFNPKLYSAVEIKKTLRGENGPRPEPPVREVSVKEFFIDLGKFIGYFILFYVTTCLFMCL